MTMLDSLVLADALFGAEGRLRQNGEVLLSAPSICQGTFGQRDLRKRCSESVVRRMYSTNRSASSPLV